MIAIDHTCLECIEMLVSEIVFRGLPPRCSQEAPVRPEVMFHYLHSKLPLLIRNDVSLSPVL